MRSVSLSRPKFAAESTPTRRGRVSIPFRRKGADSPVGIPAASRYVVVGGNHHDEKSMDNVRDRTCVFRLLKDFAATQGRLARSS